MSWCAGWLPWWGPLQWDLLWVQSLLIEVLAPRRWGFYLKSKSTDYPDHGHHGDPPPTRKIPMVEPGIETETSWLVARSSDHLTTRLVERKYGASQLRFSTRERIPGENYQHFGHSPTQTFVTLALGRKKLKSTCLKGRQIIGLPPGRPQVTGRRCITFE
jgi:hypothetical protein